MAATLWVGSLRGDVSDAKLKALFSRWAPRLGTALPQSRWPPAAGRQVAGLARVGPATAPHLPCCGPFTATVRRRFGLVQRVVPGPPPVEEGRDRWAFVTFAVAADADAAISDLDGRAGPPGEIENV